MSNVKVAPDNKSRTIDITITDREGYHSSFFVTREQIEDIIEQYNDLMLHEKV